jgi:prephenate dehydrogenase
MKTIGIIGYGDFGRLMAEQLQNKLIVRVYSRTSSNVPESVRATFEEVCACDYLVPTIPLGAYETILPDVAKRIKPGTVVIDICSVKVRAVELIKKHLPESPLVATHPLFGPQTIQHGLQDLTLVVCDDVSNTNSTDDVVDFANSQGLHVIKMSAEEHDRQMAQVHALTFFVARTLLSMNVSAVSLKTPSFEKLLSLIELERSHSQELFDTIQAGNPFASEVRQAFLAEAVKLATHLDTEDTL